MFPIALYSDQLRMVVMNSVFLDGHSAVCGIYEIIEEIIVAVLIGYPEFFLQVFQCPHTVDIREILFKQQLQR